jgi:hypothetical protein
MPTRQEFRQVFHYSQLPNDWQVLCVGTDWHGSPLIAAGEGIPPYPKGNPSAERDWFGIPAKVLHLIHWDNSSQRAVKLEKSRGLFPSAVQPVGDGWLIYDGRGGLGHVYDKSGQHQRTLDLGGGISDVQTSANGHIWVSYIDEGVFGDGIGSYGVVAFDISGQPIFKYHEFAEPHDLPSIADCYAMNVSGEDEAWLCYYTDFPLVSLKGFQLQHCWKEFGCMDKAFALVEGAVIFPKCYTRREGKSQLLRRTLSESPQTEELEPRNESGGLINGTFGAAARGKHLYLFTEAALFKMT